MSLVEVMIGLATLAVRPAWMPHYWRHFAGVLKHHHKQQPPELCQAI